jgi:hypothetical protein
MYAFIFGSKKDVRDTGWDYFFKQNLSIFSIMTKTDFFKEKFTENYILRRQLCSAAILRV